MPDLLPVLIRLYTPLLAIAGVGWFSKRFVPPTVPDRLGQGLFWLGIPFTVVVFLRRARFDGAVWLAPVLAWVGIGLALGFTTWWVRGRGLPPPSQGSCLLATMAGNTGYLGYPVLLTLYGPEHFAWVLFYDLFGSTISAYSLGVALAAKCGGGAVSGAAVGRAVLTNPVLWSFGVGLLARSWPVPAALEPFLSGGAWLVIALALALIGMRWEGLGDRWRETLPLALLKMVWVPALLLLVTRLLGLAGPPQAIVVLQAAMPPAFATLVLAEAYHLDVPLTVGTLSLGSLLWLLLLPLWLLVLAIDL
ncbi:MAG: AEC family transporter [Pseudanabaenaceae cyanobacterium]